MKQGFLKEITSVDSIIKEFGDVEKTKKWRVELYVERITLTNRKEYRH